MAQFRLLRWEYGAQPDCSGHTVFSGYTPPADAIKLMYALINSKIIRRADYIEVGFKHKLDDNSYKRISAVALKLLKAKVRMTQVGDEYYSFNVYKPCSTEELLEALATGKGSIRVRLPEGKVTLVDVEDFIDTTSIVTRYRLNLVVVKSYKRPILELLEALLGVCENINYIYISVEYEWGESCGTYMQWNANSYELVISNQDDFKEYDNTLVESVFKAIASVNARVDDMFVSWSDNDEE